MGEVDVGTLSFRFDIDTHKCIRDDVVNLLDLSEELDVKFSFFLNTGKAIFLRETMCSLKGKKNISSATKQDNENIRMLSALQKLGVKDYLIAALRNPSLIGYKNQISRMINSGNEMGIHGGINHALWHKNAEKWNEEKVKSEIEFALRNINSIVCEYKPLGFASPGWTSPHCLPKVLSELGFKYYADKRCNNSKDVIFDDKEIPCIGVNMLGEPGGVAFFENCRVLNMKNEEIINQVISSAKNNVHTVIYDHPYYSGICEVNIIREIINVCKLENIAIVTLGELL